MTYLSAANAAVIVLSQVSMKEHETALKLAGHFPPFLEKNVQALTLSEFEDLQRQYFSFCQEISRSRALETFTGEKDADIALCRALFLFWLMLNRNDPAGQRGTFLWPSFFKIARNWIVPSPPKGTGLKDHADKTNLLARLKSLSKKTSGLFQDVSQEQDLPRSIVEEIMRASTALVCAQHKVAALVEQNRTGYVYEREGISEIMASLGNEKHARALVRTLLKVLPEYGLKIQKNAKGWPARASKMETREPTPPGTELTYDQVNAQLDAMENMGLWQN